jgi:hypothetical protein
MQQKNLTNIVCFYSKYSEHSKSLITTAKSYKELESIHYVSIDSKEIRNIISTDKIYTMQSVPCIFLVYSTQLIEKYEGLDAHKWLNEVIANIKTHTQQSEQFSPLNINQHTNSTPNNTNTVNTMQSQPPQPMQSQPSMQQVTHLIDDNGSNHPMQQQPMQQQPPQPMQQQPPQPIQQQSQPPQPMQQPMQSQPPQPMQQPMQSQPPQPMQLQPQLPTPIPEHKKLPESSHNALSEHMAQTMHAAEMVKQADDRRKQETGYEHSAIRPAMSQIDENEDELPSKGRTTTEAKYARIDSIESDDEQPPELLAAIMNRGQGAKQGEGNADGPPIMNSSTVAKSSNNIDIMALAKEMEKGR